MNDVVRYYDATWLDYRVLWSDRSSRAMHFGYYDEGISSHALALQNTNNVLARLARVGPGDVVLDAGCGLGGSACWLAQHRHARCVGITPVHRQVTKARKIAAERGLSSRVEFVCGDYTHLPFGEGTFDVVWALESLCHATEKNKFYAEAARALRPGGRLVVADYMRAGRPMPAPAEAFLQPWLKGWSMPDLYTPGEHLDACRQAGFANAGISNFTPTVERSLRRLYRLALAAGPLDHMLHLLRVRDQIQHGNVVASRVQYEALHRGLWLYGVLCAAKH